MSDPTVTCAFCQAHTTDSTAWFHNNAEPKIWICDSCLRSTRATQAVDVARAASRKRIGDGARALLVALGERVVGQDAACRAVAGALLEHRAEVIRWEDDDDSGPRHSPRILLVGPPGCGKTTLCEAIRATSPWPTVIVQAEKLAILSVPAGVIDDYVIRLMDVADDIYDAERGVVLVDGFDLRAESRSAIERELIRLLDGVTLKHQYAREHIRADGLFVIVSATAEDHAAISPAVLARFDRIVKMRPLDRAALRELLTRSIDRAKRVAAAVGAELVIARPAVDVFAALAADQPDGAWAVARPLHRLLEDIVMTAPRPWLVDESFARELIARP